MRRCLQRHAITIAFLTARHDFDIKARASRCLDADDTLADACLQSARVAAAFEKKAGDGDGLVLATTRGHNSHYARAGTPGRPYRLPR